MRLSRWFLLIVIIGTIAAVVEFADARVRGMDDTDPKRPRCFQAIAAGMQLPPEADFERNLREDVETRGHRLVKTGRYSYSEVDGLVVVARYVGSMTERLIECPKPPRPECQRWPGEFWAESVRRAAKYPAGKAHRPKNNAHYWAGVIIDANGFTDANGVWHPAPKNCVA